MSKIGAILSGEDLTLPKSEFVTVVKAYDPSSSFYFVTNRFVVCDTEASPEVLMGRCAYTRLSGLLIEDHREVYRMLRGKTIKWEGYSFDDNKPNVPYWIKNIDCSVNLDDPDYIIATIKCEEDYNMLCQKVSKRRWIDRRPRARKFFHPSALYPKLARAIVNLTGSIEGSILLDPFAGTGSIPIEASIIGLEVIALDLSRKMVKGMYENMKQFNQDWLGIIRADSRNIPLNEIDCIATDIPYGRSSRIFGKMEDLILSFLLESSRILRKGKRAVIMHPSTLEIDLKGFKVEETHKIYVHRNLIRQITVMRRC